MAPQGKAYHIDWICSNTSNVHVANNKNWFTKLNEFKTRLGNVYQGPNGGPEALGIGDVELELVKSVTPSGKKKFCTVVLRDVVYAPACITNVFACSPPMGYAVDLSANKVISGDTGLPVGLVDNGLLGRLWLKGQPRGKSSLDPNGVYLINATWPADEKARWEAHKRTLPAATHDSLYNAAEKEWLKKNFGNEFKFLQQYGLSIHKDEERDEGKEIVRAMMVEELEDGEGDDEEENSFLADLEADPASHLADYHFDERELEWIERHHRHSGNFLRMYGLKPWDDGDCKEGKTIVQAFLEE